MGLALRVHPKELSRRSDDLNSYYGVFFVRLASINPFPIGLLVNHALHSTGPITMISDASMETAIRSDGKIVAIHGGVVDAFFADPVPHIHDLLFAGDVPFEVASLVGNGVVRSIALASVRGLGLGMPMRAIGAPTKVPVGEAMLGRMLNVFGEPIDGKPAPIAAAYRPIHRAPPTLEDRVVRAEILEETVALI